MKRGLFLLALIALAIFAPLAQAAGPEPRPWGSYAPGVEVLNVALAREGTTIVSALGQPPASAPGSVPTIPTPSATRNDVTVLDYGFGHARNFTVHALATGGRTHVAVSRDGLAIADLRRDVAVGAPAGAESSATRLYLHFAAIAPGGNWSGTPVIDRTVDLGLITLVSPVGVAVSDDGRRVVALTSEAGEYVLRGYGYNGGTSLDGSFTVRVDGTPRTLATSGDLTRIAVAGQFVEGNFTYGGVAVHAFAQAEPLTTWFDTSANNTDARGLAYSRDGRTLVLGGGDGRFHLFRNAREALAAPASLMLGGGAIGNLSLSEDGTRAASALGVGLTALDTSGSAPTVLWNATLGGSNVTGLALNGTGALIVASTGGTGGGVFGFSDVDNGLLWSIPGDTRGVAIDTAGTRIAYALRTAITAARIPRALTMDLAAGGKVAPTQTVTVPGTATFAVNLRNDGAALERVVFDESAPDVSVSSESGVVTVRPGAIVRANITVNVSAGLVSPRVFNVTARSLTSGAVDNVTLSVAPIPTLDVKLVLNSTDLLAQAGQPSEVLVTIVNNGTGDAPVVLRATQTVSAGADWTLSFAESQYTSLRGTRTSVNVVVTPPATATNGTTATVQFTLSGENIFDTALVSFRINPELKVEVNATAVTKFIEPGKRASYNVTVTNTGSLPRQFEVFPTVISSANRNWGVDMQSQTVSLDPLAKRVFAVAIVAPADALPQETVALLVSARSLPELPNESVVQDNVTLYGIAVEPKITTTTTPNNGIPFVAPAVAVAAIALLAAFVPRRRHP